MSMEDKAQQVELDAWERLNTPRNTKRVFDPAEPGYGPAECDECLVEMHPVRRGYGYRLCTDCSAGAPARRRLFH